MLTKIIRKILAQYCTIFTQKSPCISEPTQFEPMLFKGQQYRETRNNNGIFILLMDRRFCNVLPFQQFHVPHR